MVREGISRLKCSRRLPVQSGTKSSLCECIGHDLIRTGLYSPQPSVMSHWEREWVEVLYVVQLANVM